MSWTIRASRSPLRNAGRPAGASASSRCVGAHRSSASARNATSWATSRCAVAEQAAARARRTARRRSRSPARTPAGAAKRGRSATPRWRSARSRHRPRRRRAGVASASRPAAGARQLAASARSGASDRRSSTVWAAGPAIVAIRRPPPSRRARPPGRRAPSAPAGGRPGAPCVRAPACRSAASTSSSVAPSRLAVGSSSSSSGRVAQERPRERDALALADRQPGAAIAEQRVQALGPRRTTSVRPAARDRRARSRSIVASGRPRRMLSAIEAENRCGRCGIHETLRAPGVGIQLGSSASPTVTDPASGASRSRAARRAGSTSPHPLGPVTATTSPGSIVSESRRGPALARPGSATVSSGHGSPTRVEVRDRASADGPRGVPAVSVSSTANTCSRGAQALGAGVVVGAQQPQREVGLGRQHEHDQRGAQADVAARAAAGPRSPRPAPPRSWPPARGSARTGT